MWERTSTSVVRQWERDALTMRAWKWTLSRMQAEAARAERESSDPYWHSGRHNVKRFAMRAFDAAVATAVALVPMPSETPEQYGRRLAARIAELRDGGPDDDDESWYASAIDEAARIAGEPTPMNLTAERRAIRRGADMIATVDRHLVVTRGEDVRLRIELPAVAVQLAASPDARNAMVVVSNGPGDHPVLYRVDLEGGAVKALEVTHCYTHLMRSSEKGVVFCGGPPRLSRYAWDGTQLPAIVLDTNIDSPPLGSHDWRVRALDVSRDGSMLAVSHAPWRDENGFSPEWWGDLLLDVYVAGEARGRMNGSDAVTFAADGERIVTNRGVVAADSLELLRAQTIDFDRGVAVPGSPLVVLRTGTRLYVLDLDTMTEVATLAAYGWRNCHAIDVELDGTIRANIGDEWHEWRRSVR